jgi:tRNA (guanine-N7-)-methyltransferase
MLQMGRVRVRQHVNPLASQYQQPTPVIDWASVYADPSLPLFVDMGCGPGRFLLLLARRRQQQQQQQRMNYLGLEIRQPVSWSERLCIGHFILVQCCQESSSDHHVCDSFKASAQSDRTREKNHS